MVDSAQALTTPKADRLPILKILGDTFRIFGQAPLFFLGLSLLAALPGLIRLALVGEAAQKLSLSMGIVLVLNLLILYLIQTAITYAVARIWEGLGFTTRDALALGVQRYLPMLGAMILTILAVYGGFILLVVPGIIFLCIFAVTAPVCALEQLGSLDSMKRSAALTKGSRWRIFGVYALFFIPLIVLSLLDTFLFMRPGHIVTGLLINAAISLVWLPLATIFAAVIYFELRRLKEHVGVATVFD